MSFSIIRVDSTAANSGNVLGLRGYVVGYMVEFTQTLNHSIDQSILQGALGITVGYQYRLATKMFAICYWYVFLLDRSVWNNHSYLYGLCAIVYANINANRYW